MPQLGAALPCHMLLLEIANAIQRCWLWVLLSRLQHALKEAPQGPMESIVADNINNALLVPSQIEQELSLQLGQPVPNILRQR